MSRRNEVLEGDCVEVMAELDAESVDAIVTDPPYDLVSVTKRFGGKAARNTPAMETDEGSVWARKARGFMGKTWDGTGVAFRPETWAQALRVAKPGAHLLAFGGTRTYHRLACAIEDAGWEIRDCLVWAYASGFPKSLNFPDGWGTALKPAWEPIVMARKPLVGTVTGNRGRHGTGALNIDATRIGSGGDKGIWPVTDRAVVHEVYGARIEPAVTDNSKGRWPANVLLTDPIFDGDTPGVVGGGETASGKMQPTIVASGERTVFGQDAEAGYTTIETYGDSGTYSRFFLIPKADRADREPRILVADPDERRNHLLSESVAMTPGLSTPVERRTMGHGLLGISGDRSGQGGKAVPLEMGSSTRLNHHPTVKPTDLMRHLVRLVTPPGGLILDPFLGSGTTGIACELEGFAWLGIEREPEYVAIARARLLGTQQGMGLSA